MVLAIGTMDPVVQGIFFLVATICLVIAGLSTRPISNPMSLLPIGLAFFTFVFAWNAFAAA